MVLWITNRVIYGSGTRRGVRDMNLDVSRQRRSVLQPSVWWISVWSPRSLGAIRLSGFLEHSLRKTGYKFCLPEMVLIFGLQTGGGYSRQLWEKVQQFWLPRTERVDPRQRLVTALSGFLSGEPNSPQTPLSELQTLTQLSKFPSKAQHPGPQSPLPRYFLWV